MKIDVMERILEFFSYITYSLKKDGKVSRPFLLA